MPFRFAPRALLELGRELISSDDVAIYELLKNAVDAKSPSIEIDAQIVLTHSAYLRALESLDEGTDPKAVLAGIQKDILQSAPKSVASGFFRSLERRATESGRFRLALVGAYARDNWIEIRDAGEGMALRDLDEVFLTVGTRSRRQHNIRGARYLGDKGVGRLSAMRLGDRLLVRSTTATQAHWGRLRINWNLFSHDREESLQEINITPVSAMPKQRPDEQGTVLRISGLSGDWTATRFEQLMSGRVARMIDPFEARKSNLVVARHNGHRVVIPLVPRALLESAHATCKVRFWLEDGSGEPCLSIDADYRLRSKQRKAEFRGTEIYSLAQSDTRRRGKRGHAAFENIPIRPQALRDLGPFEADIFWYNRLVVKGIDGLTEGQLGTRTLIAQWSGGPMLYRHGFRILPYGEPDDDWLALDRNAFSEGGFKLNRQQVVGRVLIHASHMALSEQTSRQGLIESDAEAALRKMLMVALHVELRELIVEADEIERITKRQKEEAARGFRDTQEEVVEALDELRLHLLPDQIPYADRLSDRVNALADQCAALVRDLDKSVSRSDSDREKFLHLAGIGLMTEFIFHELDRAVVHTTSALTTAQSTQQMAAMRALEDQLITLQKRVSAFDELTGERRQTKTSFNLVDVINTVLDGHENEFSRHGIEVSRPFEAVVPVKAVRGMIIQIIENLIANSVYWLKLQKIYEKDFQPRLSIDVDAQLQQMTVEDNGPGVDPARAETIFQPFITTKPPGQGRGLGLYISRELATYNGFRLAMDPVPGRKRVNRLNMFVLDLGAV